MTDREIIQPEQEPVAYVCCSNPKNADGTLTNFRSWLSNQPEGYVYQPLYTAPPEQEPVACIVKGCSNHRGEGLFIGELCSPCHTFITTGEGKYSQAYRNSQREWQELTDEEMRALADKHLKYQPVEYEMSGVFDLIREVVEKLEEKNT